MNFKLSQETKLLLGGQHFLPSSKPKGYYNSQEFYKRRPDLAPRNVYLREGRILNLEDVKRTIANFGKKSLIEKIADTFKNIAKYTEITLKRIFKRK